MAEYSAARLISAVKSEFNKGEIGKDPIEIFPYDCSPGPRNGKTKRLLEFTPEQIHDFGSFIRTNDLWVAIQAHTMNPAVDKFVKPCIAQVMRLMSLAQQIGARAVIVSSGINANGEEAYNSLRLLTCLVAAKKFLPWFLLSNTEQIGNVPVLLRDITSLGKTGVCVDICNLIQYAGGVEAAAEMLKGIPPMLARRVVLFRPSVPKRKGFVPHAYFSSESDLVMQSLINPTPKIQSYLKANMAKAHKYFSALEPTPISEHEVAHAGA